jgi:hypothetical protein
MVDKIAVVRMGMRKDISSVGFLPSGHIIQLAAGDDAALNFGLLCEAVYVQMYNNRSMEEILGYISGPLGIKDEKMIRYVFASVMRVRSALAKVAGDQNAAVRALMTDRGAEEAVVKKLVEACARTAREFNVPWSKEFFPDESVKTTSPSFIGMAIFLCIVVGVLYGAYKLVRYLFG